MYIGQRALAARSQLASQHLISVFVFQPDIVMNWTLNRQLVCILITLSGGGHWFRG
jgi:hypothetical protein